MAINNPEIDALKSPGGLFDVEPCEMDLNIGKRCTYKEPTCVIEEETFTIVGVQKNYRGDKCYRVVADSDEHEFGQCAQADKVHVF